MKEILHHKMEIGPKCVFDVFQEEQMEVHEKKLEPIGILDEICNEEYNKKRR